MLHDPQTPGEAVRRIADLKAKLAARSGSEYKINRPAIEDELARLETKFCG